jgi:hypothetical protein
MLILLCVVISSIRFDDGSLRMLQHLLRLGILDIIAPEHQPELTEEQSIAKTFSKPSEPNLQTPLPALVEGKKGKASVGPMLGSRAVRSASVLDIDLITRLSDVFFLDCNVVAWTIRLHSNRALHFLVRKGYDMTWPVDTAGNTSLHFIAAHGSVEMIDLIIVGKKVRYEKLNPAGQTAGMIAAKCGNFKVAKRLFELRVSARKSLEGSYSAWVLAFARKYERNEKNLQTGRYGDDDDIYCSAASEPFYSIWYQG